MVRPNHQQEFVPCLSLSSFSSKSPVTALNVCRSQRHSTFCRFPSSTGVPVYPLQQIPAVTLVKIVVRVVDASGADEVLDTRGISPRSYRQHLPYVANIKTATSCPTYVSLRDGRILPSRVLVSIPVHLRTAAQIFVLLRPVVLVLKGCRNSRTKMGCRVYQRSRLGTGSERLCAGRV